MEKIKKFFWKLGNKRKRILRKIAAHILTSQAKSGMEKFGWKRLRWYEHTNGLWLVYYVCMDFPKSEEMPLGDNCIEINGRGSPRDNGNQEATESSRRSDSDTDEDIRTVPHPSQDGSRDHHDRTIQDQCHCDIPHRNTLRCPSQC